MKILRLFIFCLSLFVVFACEQKSKNSKRFEVELFPQRHLKRMDLGYEIKKNRSLKDNNQYKKTIERLLSQHAFQFKKNQSVAMSSDELMREIEFLFQQVQETNQGDTVFDFKESLVALGLQRNSGEINYLSTSINVFDYFFKGEVSSYSGTLLFLSTLNSLLTKKTFLDLNLVVIAERGHLLPGQMVYKEGKWHLRGIEMTSTGRGEVDYGAINQISHSIRIMNAVDFLQLEMSLLPVKEEKVMEAFNRVKQCYGFNFERFEINKRLSYLKRTSNNLHPKSLTHFSKILFGLPKVMKSSRPLENIDVIKARSRTLSYLYSSGERDFQFIKQRTQVVPSQTQEKAFQIEMYLKENTEEKRVAVFNLYQKEDLSSRFLVREDELLEIDLLPQSNCESHLQNYLSVVKLAKSLNEFEWAPLGTEAYSGESSYVLQDLSLNIRQKIFINFSEQKGKISLILKSASPTKIEKCTFQLKVIL